MVISMLKIRRPLGRLIFNMGIAIPGKTVFLIETAPSFLGCQLEQANTDNINDDDMYATHGGCYVKNELVTQLIKTYFLLYKLPLV